MTACIRGVLAMLFACSLLVLPLSAQQSGGGAIAGTVSNAETSENLEGALVELLGKDRSVRTDRQGSYSFANLPEGSYQLRISYTGLDDQIVNVDVAGYNMVRTDVAMTSDVYELETYRVTGSLEGNAAAITTQKIAPNVVNVVSMDAYGNVADGNIGNFLQRLPGIDVGKSNGDINGFGLRGIPQALSTVSMDGEMLPAAAAGEGNAGDRAYPIDNMPADMISNLRVTKSPTPDMPADSLGGNIDFVSKSALDFSGRRILYRAGLNNNFYRHHTKWTPTGSFTYMDRLGEFGDTGITVTGSYSETENTRDRLQHSYALASGAATPFYMNNTIRMLDDTFNRKRMGGSVKLEHRFSDRITVYAMLAYTRVDYNMDRFEYRVGSNYLLNTANATSDNYILGRVSPQSGAQNENKMNEMYRVNAGADFKLENGQLNIKASHGDGRSTYESTLLRMNYDRAITGSQAPLAFRITGGREQPNFDMISASDFTHAYNNPPAGFDFYDPSALDYYYPGKYYVTTENVRDLVDQVSADWKINRPGNWKFVEFIKTGVAYRIKDYRKNRQELSFDAKDPSGGTGLGYLNQIAGTGTTGYGMFNGYYQSLPTVSIDAMNAHYAQYGGNVSYFSPLTTTTDRRFSTLKDEVGSAYIMGDFGYKKFWVMAGFRYENTKTTGSGDSFTANQTIVNDFPGIENLGTLDTSFGRWFPSIHARYYITKNLILRASWSKSMGRPSIKDQIPGYSYSYGINDDDPDPSAGSKHNLELNNPELRPMYADNYDLSAEYYFSKAGVVSVGAFAKDMRNFIYKKKFFTNTYTFKMPVNMTEKAKVRGLELNYSQLLEFLPGFLGNTRLMLNCTYQSTSGDYGDSMTITEKKLVGFKPFVSNVGLMFKFWKFEVLAFLNYNKEYLAAVSSGSNLSTVMNENYYIDYDLTVDLNIKYQFHRRFVLFCDINNIFDHAPNSYLAGNKDLIRSYEKNGTRLSVGISGRW